MSDYTKLRDRQQIEMNELPLGFAFTEKQFKEQMEKWGLDPEKDKDKVARIPCGGFIQKKDAQHVAEVLERHIREIEEAIAADQTGDGFIYQMFISELDDHEYAYTGDEEETLEDLGYPMEQINADKRLKHGLEKAITTINRRNQP